MCDPADPWSLWTGPSCLRGANIYQQEDAGDPWYPRLTARDFFDLRRAGANYVNLSVPGPWDDATFAAEPASQAALDRAVNWARRAGLFVVISFRTGPGRPESDITGGGTDVAPIFEADNAAAVSAYAAMWEEVARRYRNRPHVVGYDLMVEPHDVDAAVWSDVAGTIIRAIRDVDRRTPILVSPPNYGVVGSLDGWVPPRGRRIVTTVHQYEPFTYTHFGEPAEWRPRLVDLYGRIADWRAGVDTPVAVNEFGIRQTVPGAVPFSNRQLTLLERGGYSHAVWIWEVRDPTYDFRTFDVKENRRLLKALTKRWSKNRAFPALSRECGRPRIRPDTQTLRIWRVCGTNRWHISHTGAEGRTLVRGAIRHQGGASVVRAIGLERRDVVRERNGRIGFRLLTQGGRSDGFVFRLPPGARACLIVGTGSVQVVAGTGRFEVQQRTTLPSLTDC